MDNTITDAQSRIAEAILAVKKQGGDLHIKVEIKSPSEIEDAVQERKIHVGIGPFRNNLPGLAYEPLYAEEQHLYCGRGHVLFPSASHDLSINSLHGLDYVSRGYMRESKVLGDTIRLKVAATVYNMEAVTTLLLSGQFVGYLPKHYAAQWIKQDLMRPLRPDLLSHWAEFSIVTRKNREPMTTATQIFVEALRSNLPTKTH